MTGRVPGARRHPGRRAVRTPLALRRHLPAAAHPRPRRRPRAGAAAAPDRQPGRGCRRRGRHVAHGRLHLPRAAGPRGAPGRRWTASRRSSGRGWRPGPRSWATPGRAPPTAGRSPSAPPTSTSPSPSSRSDEAQLRRRRREGPRGPRRAPRDRADLATGLLPARRPGGRRSASRTASVNPRSRAAGGPPTNPRERPLKAGRDHPGLPRRDRRAAAHADSGGAGSQRHLCRVPQAAHQGGGLPELPPRPGGEPGRGGPARREDGRTLAERRPARGVARPRRPGARQRPAAQQRLRLRRRPPWLQVPGRCPCAPRQPARRPGRGRQRGRPAAPDDPAGHQLRADAARGGRSRTTGSTAASSSSSPAPTSSDSSSSSRPSGSTTASSSAHRSSPTRSSGLARRTRAASRSRNDRSAAGCRTCRRSWSPAAASTASPRA